MKTIAFWRYVNHFPDAPKGVYFHKSQKKRRKAQRRGGGKTK